MTYSKAVFLTTCALLGILDGATAWSSSTLARHARPFSGSVLSADNYDYEESPKSSRGRTRPVRAASQAVAAEETQERVAQAAARHQEALKDPTLLSDVRFASRTDIHPNTKRAIQEVLGHEQMTDIQCKTFSVALEGKSVLGRARTGTGKTLAFLLPALERLMAMDLKVFYPGKNVGILIVAPTRELAIQIANEAKALLQFHSGTTNWSVLCTVGGTKIQKDIALLNKEIPSILVGTPGRLQDHLKTSRVKGRKLGDIVGETRLVVLDETDRLVEGFQVETKRILSHLPRPEKRQTLLFSATVPRRLRRSLEDIMPADYVEIDCITERDVASQTNARVDQSYCVLPSMEVYVSALVSIVMQAVKSEPNAKIVVFFPAAKLVKFFASLFNVGLGIPVYEMHSRITQSARNRASTAFRNDKRGVLFTSDVSARGVDYPDVSLVVQYGAPKNRELYIHRLGRTGRAGKQGKGLLVLLPFESDAAATMSRTRIAKDAKYAGIIESSAESEHLLEPVKKLIRSGHVVLTSNAETAYKAFVAYYAGKGDVTNGNELLESAALIARCVGLVELPPIAETLTEKLK